MSDVSAIVLLTVAVGTIASVFYLTKYQNQGSPVKKENFVEDLTKTLVGGFSKIVPKPVLWFVVDDYGTNTSHSDVASLGVLADLYVLDSIIGQSITPDTAEVLRFSSRGRIVYTRVVRHPGTKPNKYLADNLYLIR